VLLLCTLSLSAAALEEDLILLRNDKGEASYFEPNTIRRTGAFVMAWVVTLQDGKKRSEYLSEFDCENAKYRQLSLRVFDSASQVTSSDAIYKQWIDVPNTSQILGLLFTKACSAGTR
jgi:hypothetical protein